MPSFTQRLIQSLVAARWFCLGVAILLTAVAIQPARQLQFDRSVENMFAPDDPLLPPYRMLKRTFGGNEIVMGVYVDPELLAENGRGIRRLAEIGQRCEAVPGVRAVLSLDRPIGEIIVSTDITLAERTRVLFENYTHGTDGQTVAVVCMLEPESTVTVPRRETIDALRGVIEDLPDGLAPGMLAGEPAMVTDGFRYVEQDGRRLGIWSSVLLAVTIALCFRSLRWVLIPLAVVQFTLVLTKAALVWGQLRLSMVSSMLTAVVTVIGVATIVHVIVRYRLARAEGRASRDALVQAGTWVAAPVIWACLTDAVGFASLMVARVGPVQDFGIMMAVGSLLVIVSAGLLVPGLALWGRFDADPRNAWGERGLGKVLEGVLNAVQRHPWIVLLVASTVTATAVAGVVRLQVETDFTKNFRAGSPIVRSYEFVEQRLGGAGVLDVVLPAPPALTWDYLKRVQKLEARLRDEVRTTENGDGAPALTKVLSLSDAVGASVNPGTIRLQLFRNAAVRTALRGMKERIPAFADALYSADPASEDKYYLRIMIRARERQPAEAKRDLIEQITRISLEEFPAEPETPNAEVTGFFVLLTHLIESIVRDQWITFAVATAGIALMMTIAFRNPILALVALVPNGFPILVVLGMLGWLNLPMNMGAAMIAAVSIGLSVDSSIHYIIAFRRACRSGKRVSEALRDVQQTVGRAMVFSTLALIVGFSVLCTSEFVPTIYFGVLVSLAMLGGLVGNLVVLPLLLRAVTREVRITKD